MNRFLHKFLDLSIKRHIKNHSAQIRKIEELGFKPKRFLVISSTALGDTLLSTPAIKSLRRSFPEAEITALIHKNIAPLFTNFRYIDRIIIYHGGYKKFLKTLKELRETRPELVLIFHGNGPQDIAFSILSGAGFILKHPTKSPYRKHLSFDFEQKYQHTIEDRLDLIRKIGGAAIDTTMEIPPLIDMEREAKISNFLGDKDNYIGFQIGAANLFRMWPIENFIALARAILKHNENIKIIATGIAAERKLAQMLADACGDRIINSCGRLSIDELPYLVRKFKVLITNDTGTMHLAIALKVPTVSLFSATDSRLIGPYQDIGIHRVIQKNGVGTKILPKKLRNNEGMCLIPPDEVFEQYESLMHHRSV